MNIPSADHSKSSTNIKYRIYTWEGKSTKEDLYAIRFVGLDHYDLIKRNIELFLEIITLDSNSSYIKELKEWWPPHQPKPNDKQLLHTNIRLYQYLTGSREGGFRNKNYLDFSFSVHKLFSWKNFAYLSSPQGKDQKDSELKVEINISDRIKKLKEEISPTSPPKTNVVNEIYHQYLLNNFEKPPEEIDKRRLKAVYSRLLSNVVQYDTQLIQSNNEFSQVNYVEMKDLMKDHQCNIDLRNELKIKILPALDELLERTWKICKKSYEDNMNYSDSILQIDNNYEKDLDRVVESVIQTCIRLSKRVRLDKKKKWYFQFIKGCHEYKRSSIDDKINNIYYFLDEINEKESHKQLIAIFLGARVNEMVSYFALIAFHKIAADLKLNKDEQNIYLWLYSPNPIIGNRIPALEGLFLQAHLNNRESYELFIDYIIRINKDVDAAVLQNKYHKILLGFIKAYSVFKYLYREYDSEEKDRITYNKKFDKSSEFDENNLLEMDETFELVQEDNESSKDTEDLTFRKPRRDISKSLNKHFSLADTFDIDDEMKKTLTRHEYEIFKSHIIDKNSQQDIADDRKVRPQAINKTIMNAKRKLKKSKKMQNLYSQRDWGPFIKKIKE